MSNYQWKNLSFTLPEALVDETVIALVEDREDGGFSLTLADDELGPGGDLDAYVDGACSELESAADAYEPESRKSVKVAGLKAVRVEHLVSFGGEQRHQSQLFIRTDKGVLVVAATTEPEARDRAEKALQGLLDSLRIS